MAFRKLFFKRVNESRSNFLLAEGDIALDETTFKLFRGDGTTVGGVQISGLGGVESLSEDTSPSLGGDLDTNGNSIISASNANINIVPNGTGDVTLQTDTVQIGDSNTDATITTNGTGDLTLNTNSGTDSGSIVIADAANGNITITPNGSGQVVIDGLSFPTADGSANQVLQTDGSGNLSFATVLTDVVTDTTPQLGGDLDLNSKNITGTGNINITGTVTSDGVSLGDDEKVNLGASNDLQLYHDSTFNNSVIDNVNGHLVIRNNSSNTTKDVYIQSDNDVLITSIAAGETFAKFSDDAGVELYFDNVKKFETTSTGATVTGILKVGDGSVSDNYIGVGDADDLKIFHNGGHSIIRETGTGSLYIQSDNNVILGSDSGTETYVKGIYNGSVELYHNNVKRLDTGSHGVDITGEAHIEAATPHLTLKRTDNANVPTLRFKGSGGTVGASIDFQGTSGTANELAFQTYDGSSLAERFRVTHTGIKVTGTITGLTSISGDVTGSVFSDDSTVLVDAINATLNSSALTKPIALADNEKITFGDGNDLEIYHSGTSSFIRDVGTGPLIVNSNFFRIKNQQDTENMASFFNDGAVTLYYDNVEKFATTATGITVTGLIDGDIVGSVFSDDSTALVDAINATLNSSALTKPISLADDEKIIFGTGDDLQIWHNASNSIIQNATGQLQLRGNTIRLLNAATTKDFAFFNNDGSVDLYHDNVKKFETTATGISVTDHIALADDGELRLGTDNDMQISHSGTNGLVKSVTGTLVLQGPTVRIQDAGSSQTAISAADGIATLLFENSAKLTTNTNGIGVLGNAKFDAGTEEAFHTVTGASGVTALDCSNGHIFYKTGCTGDITANFTNLVLTAEYATNLTVIINQGATPYEVTALQIGGSGQTINWQGGSQPTGNANGIDAFSFTILNDGGTYVVLGQMVDFT